MSDIPCRFANRVARQRHPSATIRRSIRVAAMLAELHKASFQRLRAQMFMSPSGIYWRLWIAPVNAFRRRNGATMVHPGELHPTREKRVADLLQVAAKYTDGQAETGEYFGWKDATKGDARQLATKFLQRFPLLAEVGEGWDFCYAGWFLGVLGLMEQGLFPALDDEYVSSPPGHMRLLDMRPKSWGRSDAGDHFPLPPSGEYPNGECDE